MGDRGAGLDAVDILLRDAGDVLLRRAMMVDRIGGSRVAGDGDDQLVHFFFGVLLGRSEWGRDCQHNSTLSARNPQC